MKKHHLGEENYQLFILHCNPYVLYLNIVSVHTISVSHISLHLNGYKHFLIFASAFLIGTFFSLQKTVLSAAGLALPCFL